MMAQTARHLFPSSPTEPRLCPACGACLDAETHIKDGQLLRDRAQAGDITLCGECGEILVLEADPARAGRLELARPGPKALAYLRHDTRWKRLKVLSATIREFRRWAPAAKTKVQ